MKKEESVPLMEPVEKADSPNWGLHLLPVRAAVAVATVTLVISWTFGFLIRGSALGLDANAGTYGFLQCIDRGALTMFPKPRCDLIGFPVGQEFFSELPEFFLTYLFSLSGLGVGMAHNLACAIAIAVGTCGFVWITRILGADPWIGATASAIYFISPIIHSALGLPSVFFGFAFMPLMVASGFAICTSKDLRHAVTAIVALTAASAMVILSDAYPFVVGAALVGAISVTSILVRLLTIRPADETNKLLLAAASPLVILPTVVLLWRAWAGSLVEQVGSVAVHRAMGVDLILLLNPTTMGGTLSAKILSAIWANTTPLNTPRGESAFWGAGEQTFVYTGAVLITVALIGFFLLDRDLKRRHLMLQRLAVIGLLIGACGCLILSLGPSLKVGSTGVAPPIGYSYASYLMPVNATFGDFPWASVYDYAPFKNMRATFRWNAGLRLALSLLVALAAAIVWKRYRFGRVLAPALLFLVLLELPLLEIQNWQSNAHAYAKANAQYAIDIDQSFGQKFAAGERVLILPSENDYLAADLGPRLGVRLMNVAGDKENTRIRLARPPWINDLIAAYGSQSAVNLVCEAFRSGRLDALILVTFDLRYSSYSWKPDATRIAAYTKLAKPIVTDPAFHVERRPLGWIVEPKKDAANTC